METKKGHPSYLSKTNCDEFIELLGQKVLEFIVTEVKRAKYYSLIVDSTPDFTHENQFSVILCYYLHGTIREDLIGYIPTESQMGKLLFQIMNSLLDANDNAIENSRDQSYNNTSNMSEKYEDFQAYIKKE